MTGYFKYSGTAAYLSIVMILLTCHGTHAEELQRTQVSNGVPVMPKVIVSGSRIDPEPGTTSLDEKQLEQLPNKGTITDYLKIVPGVQFSEQSNSSSQPGEIEPENISISGGRGYENNFLIDGISNSSSLDPDALKIDDFHILASNPQEIYINPNLLKSLTVHDHNISARYGNFTGGVVDAETIDPGSKLAGNFSYKTTRDNWTNFYIHPDDDEDFQNANRTSTQPHFDKHYANVQLSGPINDRHGLLFAYSKNYSRIPLNPFGEQEIQTRDSDNYYLKLVSELSADTLLRSSFTFAPYRANVFLNQTLNSNFINSSETYAVQSNIETTTTVGTLELNATVKKNIDEREAPDHFFSWKSTFGPTKDWGTLINRSSSNEGGFGDLTRKSQAINLQTHLNGHPITFYKLETRINLGLEYEHIQAKNLRPNTVYSYRTPIQLNPGDLCVPNDPACVAGEQYLSKRSVYPTGSASERVNSLASYFELDENISRLTFKPGLRVSYDDLMKNLNTAPRLSIVLDFFGNDNSTLTFGANRYYGKNLLAAKLREAILPLVTSTRLDQFTDWTDPIESASPAITKFSTLKTPYSDELSFDFRQKILTSTLTLGFIHRQNNDQLAKEKNPDLNADGYRETTLNNNGSSEYSSFRINWEKQWRRHSFAINATYEATTSSNESYTETLDEEDLEDFAYHDGELKLKTNLPRTDYTRPWTVTMIYMAEFPYGLSFANTTRYQSRYRALGDTKKNISIDGESYDIYDEISKHSALTFDWKIGWEKELSDFQSLEFNLDVFNVFNRKVEIGTEDDEYKLGRQYWAGMTCKF